MRIPRILIAGTHSGVGKTTMTLALLAVLKKSGVQVQPFKAGPDYIDPGYHSAAAGRLCRNLDSWLIPPHRLPELFRRACRGADLALIEGVMGLYDGASATGDAGSTAELAKLLDCPVLLVLDAAALSRSAAAVVRGFRDMDRKVRIAGCLVNRMAGEGHYRLVKTAIEKLAGLPVVGWLLRDREIQLPERHLGLVPAAERKDLDPLLKRLERLAASNFDLSAIHRIAGSAPSWPSLRAPKGRSNLPGDCFVADAPRNDNPRIPIAVARDEVFNFYYPENLELLEDLGAEIAPFSPLKDRRLPRGAAALYLGGGFPEIFAPQLARNLRMKREIHQAIATGMPTYAECGGLMYLAQAIQDGKSRRHSMTGVLPGEVRMTDRLQNFGYKTLRARKNSLLARKGEQARGHEFHHSIWSGFSGRWAAYEAASAAGTGKRPEGYSSRNLTASYVHLHFWSQPRWAERFVQSAWVYMNRQVKSLLSHHNSNNISWF